ncbi:alpha-glucan family phosphorylase [Hymenobacter caeli]|uniref:Starch phosphorylase n=1 Tax=Hymenobacter caeli TaxID=2735894 RepID=A0ABX2FT70_9BACT|nr:alpha-glucan family phosphorylase [Hymenobacter caeli]NRT19595.1 starch phosphorylase [Hymenobacter caeli]
MTTDSPTFRRSHGFLPTEMTGLDTLTGLALDLRWSWNHAADALWQQLDAELWDRTHNPWVVLQTASREALQQRLADPAFRAQMAALLAQQQCAAAEPKWFQSQHPAAALTCVAYFSMEFMLSEALPIYVGGLGNVAGDQLKSASDLGVPVVAVGLLYQQGYFRQEIDRQGAQQALFPYNDPGQLPITPLRLASGEWLRLKIALSGFPVWLRTWQVRVGGVMLYLLDSNDAANLPVHRGLTAELYGGGMELRIQQEIILGIGGWQLLKALGIKPEVCHLNEGHAAFVVLERARTLMQETGLAFAAALAVARPGNLFTTHTAVAAGFDHFSPALMSQFLGDYARQELKIDFETLMALGRQSPTNPAESFNMAFLAIRGGGAVNGVSRLHGAVSRQLFGALFPRWPTDEVPVGHVTNGVHMPSWDAEAADALWTAACGKDRWRGGLDALAAHIGQVPDEALWQLRTSCRQDLVAYTRARLARQFTVSGQPPALVDIASKVFDENTLTIGFARRFVAYKRPNLLLHDPERFIRLLTNRAQPVQLVLAGKAPPFDEAGKALIQQWMQFIAQHNLYQHVVFLSDYDLLLAEHLVQGVDVWLNTPRRPWEACGTSGMKVLVNGGLNLSELDGWWAEAYAPEVGWALGDGQEHGDDPAQDAAEADALYTLLETQVGPEFYQRDARGIPVRWVERMRQSMATLTPQFSANRTVREYTENYYLPAATRYAQRAANKGAAGAAIVQQRQHIGDEWDKLAFGEVQTEAVANGYLFRVPVRLGALTPDQVLVELYANGLGGAAALRIPLVPDAASSAEGRYQYQALVTTTRPAGDFTARLLPTYEGLAVPLEDDRILWQR